MSTPKEVQEASTWLGKHLVEVVAFLKTAVKTHEERSEKPKTP